jgi:hypothetical protein
MEGSVRKGVHMSVSARLLITGSLVAFLAGCAGTGQTALTCGPQEQNLRFKLKDDGCVKGITNRWGQDKESIEICQGGTVTWKVKKPSHRNGELKKSIVFETAAGSPLEWKDSGFQGETIAGKVRDDAPTGGDGFKYTVRTERGPGDVCAHDPMIIVKPK